MMMSVLPLKKLRRNGRYIFGAILVVGIVAVFHEFVAANTWGNHHHRKLGLQLLEGGLATGCLNKCPPFCSCTDSNRLTQMNRQNLLIFFKCNPDGSLTFGRNLM